MKKQTWGITAAVLTAGLMMAAPTQLHTWAQTTGAANSSAAIPPQQNENLRVKQLELAIQPESAEDAIQAFVKSHQSRNGALLYAILTPEEQKRHYATFVKMNWVLGVSSPWVKGYRVTSINEKDEANIEYKLELLQYTSTGFMGTEPVTVTLKKEDAYWHIADYKPVQFATKMNLLEEKLSQDTVLGLVKEAKQRYIYLNSGGKGTGGLIPTFKPEGADGPDYRFLSEDIGTKEKLTRLLHDVYAEAAVTTFLNEQFKQKSLIEEGDQLAQPHADGGSMLEWGNAKITKLLQNGDSATVQLKVPQGETEARDFSVSFTYEKNVGWRIASPITTIR